MRKRELVHYHALLDRVSRYMRRREDLPADALEAYEELGVSPAAVYRSKRDHEVAVTTLTERLADAARQADAVEEHDDQQASAHGD
ncbi:UPF0058 family protein [Halomarina ordinaria]|uniref:UPF0058 family protein n=1 Tax=Halomarina ordinaria TaxID=3033939 RepID=A0ABD5U6J5_9EURY|nr:UPF0058 family protein [Halomarina sp. PSRA2]